MAKVLDRPPTERERIAQQIFERLHRVMAWFSVVFVLVVLGDAFVPHEGRADDVLTGVGWFIWGIFVTEYLARLVIAPSTADFLKRNWWQVIFLALPFFAFLRIVLALRVARAGRLVSAAVRGRRTAGQKLSSRVGWLGALTVIVVLFGANVLYEFGEVTPFGRALHDAAMAAIGGEPVAQPSAVVAILNVLLVLYSVVVFATLAGALGAYFFEHRGDAVRSES